MCNCTLTTSDNKFKKWKGQTRYKATVDHMMTSSQIPEIYPSMTRMHLIIYIFIFYSKDNFVLCIKEYTLLIADFEKKPEETKICMEIDPINRYIPC